MCPASLLRGFDTHRRYVSVRGDRCQTDLDLAFIVDGSGSIESYFPGVRAFIADVVEYFEIGSEQSRVALVTYSDNAVLAFNFNGEQTPRDPVTPQGKRAMRHADSSPAQTDLDESKHAFATFAAFHSLYSPSSCWDLG